MILIHDTAHRGHTRQGWLDSHHTFSFGGFQDPTRMGFGALRVINEDRVIPGAGFSEHAHDNMDILTIVLSGKLRHRDTLGNTSIISAGDAQLMSAGSGLRHEEMNASDEDTAHFLQIWIIPDTVGGDPTYQQKPLPAPQTARDWTLIASNNAGDDMLKLISDTRVYIANPHEDDTLAIPHHPDRLTFVQIVSGLAMVDGERLGPGTGLQIAGEEIPPLEWITQGQALLFDLQR
ncbi:pirin family protein [Martelella endophytica]|uniref:Quercetin 2,3-dioxygenase n=1 Tax=Martelella endophytica TaxID=1486262 RepID=A0A0D5LS46_MAREN|nr:pirin family protein [Martelella endophytica]AJY46795.1 hypothetical protein TM49_15755 [Martelella endophytica]